VNCIKVREIRGTRFEVCEDCGDRLENIAVERADLARRGSFFELLPGAFLYPFTGAGVAMLVLGFFFFFGFLKVLSFTLMGKTLGIFGAGYFIAWLFKITSESALGKQEISGWPDFTDIFSDIIDPLKCTLVTTLVSFGPAIVCLLLGVLTQPLFFILAIPAGLAGAIYYPMALLATALNTRLALCPGVIFGSITRTLGPYAAACFVFVLSGVAFSLGMLVLDVMLPILGSVLGFGISMYLSVVEMRILGLLYYTNKERLDWF
jgi:hypothetical protein